MRYVPVSFAFTFLFDLVYFVADTLFALHASIIRRRNIKQLFARTVGVRIERFIDFFFFFSSILNETEATGGRRSHGERTCSIRAH